MFSDVIRGKRSLGWRTVLVIPELERSVCRFTLLCTRAFVHLCSVIIISTSGFPLFLHPGRSRGRSLLALLSLV